MHFRFILMIGLLLTTQLAVAQKKVSITIDDVPNTSNYEKDGYSSKLLQQLDSLNIPIAIFVNEGLIYKSDSVSENFELLNNWSGKEGNHSFGHSRYSESGIELFSKDVLNGEAISRNLSKVHDKPLEYFRFPYNDIGKDSLQHTQIKSFLAEHGYQITPFTIESSDWMFNEVYEYYLNQNNTEKAREIGELYVAKTLEYFDFFEDLGEGEYQRDVHQIYLCHDNKINADYLSTIVNELKMRDYEFISLEEALTDTMYNQQDSYYQKWGVSWFYRWIPTQKERVSFMMQEPDMDIILSLYDDIQNAASGD